MFSLFFYFYLKLYNRRHVICKNVFNKCNKDEMIKDFENIVHESEQFVKSI